MSRMANWDALLPKPISGELRVKNVHALIAGAGWYARAPAFEPTSTLCN